MVNKMVTDTREKIALYLDRTDLEALRGIQKRLGVPVSESVRRAVAAYLRPGDTGKKK